MLLDPTALWITNPDGLEGMLISAFSTEILFEGLFVTPKVRVTFVFPELIDMGETVPAKTGIFPWLDVAVKVVKAPLVANPWKLKVSPESPPNTLAVH